MFDLWDRLLDLLQTRRISRSRYFELEESLHSARIERSDREQRPAGQIQAELHASGLAQLQDSDGLRQRWQALSRREKEVTAFTCLGCANRQMAAQLRVSPGTIKTHLNNTLIKFGLHSKTELRLALSEWVLSEWGCPQQ